MNDGCPFCRIYASDPIFMTDHVFALWDKSPVNKGHLLIIPKRHFTNWFDATPDEYLDICESLKIGQQKIFNEYGATDFNIIVNVGNASGQNIDHLHIHLIPRKNGDTPNQLGNILNIKSETTRGIAPTRSGIDLFSESSLSSYLVKGENDPLLPHIKKAIDNSIKIDLAIAFILKSGVELVLDHLRDLIARGGQIRIVTGDYLDATDPDALLQLMDIGDQVQLRVFESKSVSYHPKAYIFYDESNDGTAYVGSSNLTSPALEKGVEWNYRVLSSSAQDGFHEVASAFEGLYKHPSTRVVDQNWIDEYRQRRQLVTSNHPKEVQDEPVMPPPEPHSVQKEALSKLVATRKLSNEAGLVVMATGLGKTWLAAFDAARPEFKRILFVAHREEILNQALKTFRRIMPQANLGLYTGNEKNKDADVLFSSIQTLSRKQHLHQFPSNHFDYIVIDEFHHAAAQTYRRLIDYFTPHFLLGLTATPERSDGGDLLGLCQENLVYRKDMIDGIKQDLLCPFDYFGVPDDVNYQNVPWRSNRFDEEALTTAVATSDRAENILEQYRLKSGERTLAFCCTQRHADYMADYFTNKDVRAVAVHSGPRSAPRASALEALEAGQLDVIFAVDMFNEGLDMPNIDTVMMLRPTESNVIWLQQFGRGLRKSDAKHKLCVIDYIGNHRSFLLKVRSLLEPLLGVLNVDSDIKKALQAVADKNIALPEGCGITYDLETIKILESLLKERKADDSLRAFYEDFRERHGVRPTASELMHSGYDPSALRSSHNSWFGFVRSMEDLSESEEQTFNLAHNFLEAFEQTPMSNCFKMLTVLAMLNQDAFPGQITLDQLSIEFERISKRNKVFRDEVQSAVAMTSDLSLFLETQPIKAWTGRRSAKKGNYFRYNKKKLIFDLNLPMEHNHSLQYFVRELVDWKLAEYLISPTDNAMLEPMTCRVERLNGSPVVKLPDDNQLIMMLSDIQSINIDGKLLLLEHDDSCISGLFDTKDEDKNLLPNYMDKWFGGDAGQPGTKHHVEISFKSGEVTISPSLNNPDQNAELWNHYMREKIPAQHGYEFNTGSWNQGFVRKDEDVFLLVTLDKGGMNEDHRYSDHFISSELFHWQSQNSKKQSSRAGNIIRNHASEGYTIHLYIRKSKRISGKSSPFVYCGPVDFVEWEGEKPISVTWRLREPVPENLHEALNVPN